MYHTAYRVGARMVPGDDQGHENSLHAQYIHQHPKPSLRPPGLLDDDHAVIRFLRIKNQITQVCHLANGTGFNWQPDGFFNISHRPENSFIALYFVSIHNTIANYFWFRDGGHQSAQVLP